MPIDLIFKNSKSISNLEESVGRLKKGLETVSVFEVPSYLSILKASSPDPGPVVITSLAPRYAWLTFEKRRPNEELPITTFATVLPDVASIKFVALITLPVIFWLTCKSKR